MSKFKAGDLVYYPQMGCGIFTLQAVRKSIMYPIKICRDDFAEFLTEDGKLYDHDQAAMIFHATPENHELLEKLYGVEFEKPPVKLTSREIIQAMFKRGDRSVTCWVSDTNENPDSHHTWAFIRSVSDKLFIDKDGSAWRFATPFDRRTGEAITELPT